MATASALQRRVPRPPDEAERLAALHRLQVLDTPPDADFDFLTQLAARLCDAPCAFVTLVDADRAWVKSAYGFEAGALARDDSVCAWCILEDGGIAIRDLAADPRTAGLPITTGAARMRAYHGTNLVTDDGRRIGTLCVLDSRARTFDLDQRNVLARLGRQVMALVEGRAHRRQLQVAQVALETQATIDELTGLAQRRVLLERLAQEVERARRFGSALSVVLIDLDQFKTVNDLHGHAVGDQVLRNVGNQVRNHLRQIDLAGRHAGEQLCLVLPGTPPAGAVEVANSLRQTLAGYVHRCDRHLLSITASFGVAGLEAGAPAGNVAELLKAADAALLRAKERGRNRVED
jgi:diguanylate cyclase (GGDEF)-like protein